MSYLALYRKYRSQTFGDLVGQEQVVRTLQNGIVQGKVAHAFLFTGPRGTGKTSTARLLAKTLNCESGPNAEPCNECPTCRAITEGSCLDVIEMDAASQSGVDEVREKIVNVTEYRPAFCRYKIFIIDEVHDLSSKAFDALLKTIEEPPPHIVFILATTEYNKVPPTIRARCQRYEFHRASLANLIQRLEFVSQSEGVQAEGAALGAIARLADGGYRDALTLLEQAMIVGEGKITLQQVYDQLGLVGEEAVDEILFAVKENDPAKLMALFDEVYRLGRDPSAILDSLMYRLSDLTRAAYGVDLGANSDSALEAGLHATATRLGRDTLLRLRGALAEAHKQLRDVTLPRIWLEAEFLRIAGGDTRPAPIETVVARPEPERKAAATPAPAPNPAPPPAAPKPTATGDPALDAAQSLWSKAVAELGAKSNSAAMKLRKTRVIAAERRRMRVEFDLEVELLWITESPKRQALVREKVAEIAGETWEIDYCIAPKSNGTSQAETVTVELPAEGSQLAEIAREVFDGL
ncbi:MAG TPA: DNA polymerase III subunit gamma/tau [Fimbriimonadaceae bacterium]|nr:DNA polymerase III subunit gamma/tau [Fimbriimonadaceae bacterium]